MLACQPQTGACGAVHSPDGISCEDGNPCTVNDTCLGGVCVSGKTSVCVCQHASDCAKQEDGNLCNGTLYCHLPTGKCLLNPATVVYCPPALPGSCVGHACNPVTGLCEPGAVADGTPCDDGDKCTIAEKCQAGACLGGKAKPCEDGEKCTADACDAGSGACIHAVIPGCEE
jgi:hypothetical protein